MDYGFQAGKVHPEEDYEQLRRLGAKLGVPVPLSFIEVYAINPDGSRGDYYSGRARTYNRNFWNLIFALASSAPAGTSTYAAGFLAMKNTAGTTAGKNWTITGNSAHAGATITGLVGSTTYGIVAGTSTTAESFEHFTLQSLIAHGNSSGQLSYTAGTTTSVSYDSGTKVWTATVIRIMNNNSGATIIVAETGLYMTMQESSTPESFMIERTLLGSTVSVLNTGQLTVTYTITLTFPA